MNERTGIAVAGTLLVDKLYEIDAYPAAGELTKIKSISLSVGGLVPNNGIGLKRIDPQIPIFAIGRVGKDSEGDFALEVMEREGVDTSHIIRSDTERTGFTDVMSVSGGQRTFFTHAGGGGSFGYDDIPWDDLRCRMLHLGYFLLLDRVDAGDGVRILQKAKEQGITTSIDLVSENSDRYSRVLPSLPYVDNLILNELEAGKLADIEPTEKNLSAIAQKLLSLGVRERVIIHTPAMAICADAQGCTVLPSFSLPKGYIQGTTGAGDAFCSGALIGIYYGKSNEEILHIARMAAAASLRVVDATSGLCPLAALYELVKTLE